MTRKVKFGPAQETDYPSDNITYDLLMKEGRGPWQAIGWVEAHKIDSNNDRMFNPRWVIGGYEADLYDTPETITVDTYEAGRGRWAKPIRLRTSAEAKRELKELVLALLDD